MFIKRTQFVSVLALIIMLILPIMPASASAPANQQGVLISRHALTGMVSFMGAPASGRAIREATALDKNATAEDVARSFLSAQGSQFGIANARTDLKVLRETKADNGNNTVRFQQTYQGIPVLAGEMIIHMDSGKNVLSAMGEILPGIDLDINPLIDEAAAVQTALAVTAKENGVSVDALQTSTPELWIYNPALLTPYTGQTVLGWRMEVTPKTGILPVRQLVLVEAKRGGIALSFNQVDYAKNRETYDSGGTATNPPTGTLVCNESNPTCAGGSTDAINAHVFAGQTYDFYLTNHARDSIDGAGMLLKSFVNYDVGFQNAFWDGTEMVYGAGFSSADDVVAHELTHGVTEHESNLFYYYQSGAINESFSDVWGEFVDLGNGAGTDTALTRWQMGEDLTAFGVIRDMEDPTIYGDPDKMTSVNYSFDTSYVDNGGVHSNSGINNKAVFLMVDGGTFNGRTVTALGIVKVAKIYYYAQTNLLNSGSDYSSLYYALQTSCSALIGTAGITSADCLEVLDAINAVEMNLQPVAGFNTEKALCDFPGEIPVNRFYDNLENGAGNWVSGATTGTNRWTYDSIYGPFAHSGDHFLYGDDYDFPFDIADSYIQTLNSITVPTNGKLLIHHAYHFESNFDGGVIEYSTNGGGAWTDAGPLIEGNGYDALLSSSFGNPLGGRQAFTGPSHGYISTRLNLSSLAGQNVMFRFRFGVDNIVYYWGWWVDDVRIYQCASPLANGGDTSGVFRPGNGLLYLKNLNSTGFADVAINYGTGGDYPVSGDWDGNGSDTIGIYRNGSFYLRNSNTLGFADLVFAFGQPGDQPIAGDWDGDGIDTIGVYRSSTGQFLLRNINTAGPAEMAFYLGNVGDVGIAGDWNGDNMDTTGVFRPGNGVIFLKNANTTGFADIALNYGLAGDLPVTGDWNNDGTDTIGVYRNAQFLLRNSNTIGFADIVFGLGNPGDMPISGNWDNLP